LLAIPEQYRPKLTTKMPVDFYLLQNTYWQAWVGVNAISAQKQGAEAALAQLYTERANPQAIKTKANEAASALAQADAQVAAARAQLSGLQAGATAEQLAALQARIDQAQAGRESLIKQHGLMTIKAPMTGTVIEIIAHPSEVAATGSVLLNLADTRQATLTVYVPENQIGQVRMDQPVKVTVDSFPGRQFEGRVSHIASQTEYTPRNVATKQERINLVLAVEVRIANDDGGLKPGMPADATFAK
jgi:HlyD family secretion protein